MQAIMSASSAHEGPQSSSPRRFTRYPADIRIEAQVFRPSGTVSAWGRSSEIGEDGIGGTLTAEVEPGEVVSMEITLPMSNTSMKFRALVRYRIGLRHGFEFLALSPEQRAALRQLCEGLSDER
jgi:PilZ domain